MILIHMSVHFFGDLEIYGPLLCAAITYESLVLFAIMDSFALVFKDVWETLLLKRNPILASQEAMLCPGVVTKLLLY